MPLLYTIRDNTTALGFELDTFWIQAGLDNGCEYFFIEQDVSYDRTAVESAEISYRNLVAMGYADML